MFSGKNKFAPLPLSFAIALFSTHSSAQDFSIPQGALSDALLQFSQTSGSYLSVSSELLKNKTSQGLQGDYAIKDALNHLLKGTGLAATEHADGSFSIRQVTATAELETAVVIARDVEDTSQTYTVDNAGYTKSKRPLLETPQSISVLTQKRLQEQNTNSLLNAYQSMPGVVTYGYLMGTNMPYARGFQLNSFQINGVPTAIQNDMGSIGWAQLLEYDRIELLKGSAGLFQGSSSPAGAINMVRKRANSNTFKGSTTTSVGSWHNYRQEVDVQGPLNAQGSIRGRAVASYDRGHEFYDRQTHKNRGIFTTIEADLSDNTLLTTGYSYSYAQNDDIFSFGLPRYSNNQKIDFKRSTNLSSRDDYSYVETNKIFAELKHSFDGNWNMHLGLNYLKTNNDVIYSKTGGAIDPTDFSGGYNWAESRAENTQQYNFDGYINGNFNLAGREHELTLGGSIIHANRQANRFRAYPSNRYSNIENIFDFDLPHSYRSEKFQRQKSQLDQYGAYGMLTFNLADPLDFLVGARSSWWEYQQTITPIKNGVRQNSSKVTQEVNGKTTPFYGLVYRLNKSTSLYASYGETFSPQLNLFSYNGSPLPPVKGQTYELGLKKEHFEGALTTNFALFRTYQMGTGEIDRKYPHPCMSPGTDICSAPSGKIKSEGFEAELNGEVAEGLNIAASYTYNRSKYIKNNNDPQLEGKTALMYMPKHLVRIWGNYQLPGAYQQWQVGLGANIQSSTSNFYKVNNNNIYSTTSGYAVYNARIAYQINDTINLSLNVDNIFDKTYHKIPGNLDTQAFYGAPRSTTLTLRTSF